jgi:hypothetical protein
VQAASQRALGRAMVGKMSAKLCAPAHRPTPPRHRCLAPSPLHHHRRRTPLPRASHPGIEKWVSFKENYHLRFRYTPKTVLNSLLWGLAVPVGIYFLIRNEHVRARQPPPPATPASAQAH